MFTSGASGPMGRTQAFPRGPSLEGLPSPPPGGASPSPSEAAAWGSSLRWGGAPWVEGQPSPEPEGLPPSAHQSCFPHSTLAGRWVPVSRLSLAGVQRPVPHRNHGCSTRPRVSCGELGGTPGGGSEGVRRCDQEQGRVQGTVRAQDPRCAQARTWAQDGGCRAAGSGGQGGPGRGSPSGSSSQGCSGFTVSSTRAPCGWPGVVWARGRQRQGLGEQQALGGTGGPREQGAEGEPWVHRALMSLRSEAITVGSSYRGVWVQQALQGLGWVWGGGDTRLQAQAAHRAVGRPTEMPSPPGGRRA